MAGFDQLSADALFLILGGYGDGAETQARIFFAFLALDIDREE